MQPSTDDNATNRAVSAHRADPLACVQPQSSGVLRPPIRGLLAVVCLALASHGMLGCTDESGLECGPGTRSEGGVCIVEAEDMIGGDTARPDATDATPDGGADSAQSDTTATDGQDAGDTRTAGDTATSDTRPSDTSIGDATERDIDKSIPPGSTCDPNYFEPWCEGSTATVCEDGVVREREPCFDGEDCIMYCTRQGETCNPIYRESYCLPKGITDEPCDLETFESGCMDGVHERCDPRVFRVIRRDCTAEGLVCSEESFDPCVDPDAVSCRDEGWSPACLDATTVESCLGDGTVGSLDCTSRGEGWGCEDLPFDDRAACVPPDAEFCDSETFEARCDGNVSVNCYFYVAEWECPGLTECTLVSGLNRAVCVLPDAQRCDPDYYVGWCDGNTAVNCDPSTWHTSRMECGTTGGSGTCVSDEIFGEAYCMF